MEQLAVMPAEKTDGMTSMKRFIISLSLLTLICSCAETVAPEVQFPEPVGQEEYQSVTMVIPPILFDEDEPMTRINLNLSSLKYLWAEEDSVGIFPDMGSQIYFSMAEGVGQSVATFDGS